MATIGAQNVGDKATETIQILSEMFGSYKAEWLREKVFELYSEPAYFPELETTRPCVLVGGRGTGKTTALRTLSYEGQFALRNDSDRTSFQAPYFGIYYRVSTPHVTLFDGKLFDGEDWRKLFIHFFNLTISDLLVRFLIWHQEHLDPNLSIESELPRLSKILCLPEANNLSNFRENIRDALHDIEYYVNNFDEDNKPKLSSLSVPIDYFFKVLKGHPAFKDKMFFVLIDEYENFLDYQQEIINSLIKHSGELFTYKIGVRELGWRNRETLNENEKLTSPADYVRIDISERLDNKAFAEFASNVCNARIKKVFNYLGEDNPDVSDMFPSLSAEEEAKRLGITKITEKLRREVRNKFSIEVQNELLSMSDLELHLLDYWAEGKNTDFTKMASDYLSDRKKWRYRFKEYKYAQLFTIRRKKSGLWKFYCGWDTFINISGRNIRYLLELVEKSLVLHLYNEGKFGQPIDYKIQTQAAKEIGQKNLAELEGISKLGAHLTKLVLGLGRVFNVMATNPAGHAPEVNQFKININHIAPSDEPEWLAHADSQFAQIMKQAIMHLAIVRFPGDKNKVEGETRESSYQLHPIFAPYFVYSHRKRRNFVLDEDDILGLINSPRDAIKKILKKNKRSWNEPAPEELPLFSSLLGINDVQN